LSFSQLAFAKGKVRITKKGKSRIQKFTKISEKVASIQKDQTSYFEKLIATEPNIGHVGSSPTSLTLLKS